MTFIVTVTYLLIYLAPTAVAAHRKHEQLNMILVLNVFLGWTFLGWVIALMWALRK